MSSKKKDHWHLITRGPIWLHFDGLTPKLSIHEKYEGLVKWSLRSAIAVAVLVSFASLPWFIGGPVSLALVVANWFIERAVFVYMSMFIGPIAFPYDPERWRSMTYLWIEHPDHPKLDAPTIVLLVFDEEAYAVEFFDFLKSWNYGERVDDNNNIRLSFVTWEDIYYVFLYPSPNRKAPRQFFTQVKKEFRKEKKGKQHIGLVVTQTFQKRFSTMSGYGLGEFVKRTRRGKSFYLIPAVQATGDSKPRPLNEHRIEKKHFKNKNRHELVDEDFELQLWKLLDLD